jgi:parallel beta-helix repeat protein
MTISGNARPEIRENIFQETGFGINIAENSFPVVVANQIQNNRSGIIIQANATPMLRNNIIQGNKEDGLVVIAQARPDLGLSHDPGKNVFQNNGRYDINAKAAKLVFPAAGNNLVSNRIQGKVDLEGITAPTVRNSANPQNSVSSRMRNLPNPNQSSSSQFNYVGLDSGAIEFVAPQAAAGRNTRNSNPGLSFQAYGNTDKNTRYRVLVLVANQQEKDLVNSLATDAFPKFWQGRRVMQVGVFSSQENASELVNVFNSRGLRSVVEPVR